MNKNSNWLTHRFSGGKKIALFMLPPLSLGLGAEKYFIELVRNLQIRELGADVVTMDEKFYQKFARALHIFFSLNFFKSIDISGHESEGWVKKNLGQSKWIKTSFKNLANTLQKYDLIYSKNEIADLLLLKLIGFKNLPPIVVGVHTPILYPRANSFSAKLHNFLYSSLFYKWLLRKVKLIHLSNNFTYKLIKEKFKIPARLIYYPFEIKPIQHQTNLKFDSNKINIIHVARLSEQKGTHLLINLIKKISLEQNLNQKISLNIFGSGDKNTEKIFKKINEKYSWLKYFGHLENKLVPSVLSKQNLFISLAQWETMPFNILEAQSLGLPVIAFNIPGPQDIIINNQTGWLVDNEYEFLNKIKEFIQHNTFDNQKIITHTQKKFNPDKIYPEIIEMFNSVIGNQ